MRTRIVVALIGVLTLGRTGVQSASPQPGDERATVELNFAKQHVPEKLAAGDKLILHYVTSMARTRTGIETYSTVIVAKNVEAKEIKRTEKPDDPEKAVTVKLLVSADDAAKIERLKKAEVNVYENGTTKKKPLTWRLEPQVAEKP